MRLEPFRLIQKNRSMVEEALKQGEFDEVFGTQLTVAEGYVLCALREGRLQQWVEAFPEPRKQEEIGCKEFLTGGLAAAFHGFFSQSGIPFALRSHTLLGELGYSVEVLEPGAGISRRGTRHPLPFTPDAVRKWLDSLSQREVLGEVSQDPHPEDCRKGQSLIDWYNQQVGPSFREGYGRCVHAFDGTEIPVCYDNDHYEGSGEVKHEDGTRVRGYKAGVLKSYLGQADVITAVEVGPIQRHDLVLAQRLLFHSSVLKPGDVLIYDRGLLDGGLITRLKKELEVSVIVPVKGNMVILDEAQALAEMEEEEARRRGKTVWRKHPFRKGEEVTLVRGLSHVWEGCEVELHGALVRFRKLDGHFGYVLFVCSDLSLTAHQILRTYRLRVEIEEDNKQVKGPWEIGEFTSTNRVDVVFQMVMVLAAYSLFAYYHGTKAGRQFCQKTIQAAKRHEKDSRNIRIIVVARGYFVMLRVVEFGLWLVKVPEAGREKLAKEFEQLVGNTEDLWPFELDP
jgi:hypothetical protein